MIMIKPADQLDRAQEQEEHLKAEEIKRIRSLGQELPRIGFCHNCRESIDGLFCDEDCRDDYYRLKINKLGKVR